MSVTFPQCLMHPSPLRLTSGSLARITWVFLRKGPWPVGVPERGLRDCTTCGDICGWWVRYTKGLGIFQEGKICLAWMYISRMWWLRDPEHCKLQSGTVACLHGSGLIHQVTFYTHNVTHTCTYTHVYTDRLFRWGGQFKSNPRSRFMAQAKGNVSILQVATGD